MRQDSAFIEITEDLLNRRKWASRFYYAISTMTVVIAVSIIAYACWILCSAYVTFAAVLLLAGMLGFGLHLLCHMACLMAARWSSGKPYLAEANVSLNIKKPWYWLLAIIWFLSFASLLAGLGMGGLLDCVGLACLSQHILLYTTVLSVILIFAYRGLVAAGDTVARREYRHIDAVKIKRLCIARLCVVVIGLVIGGAGLYGMVASLALGAAITFNTLAAYLSVILLVLGTGVFMCGLRGQFGLADAPRSWRYTHEHLMAFFVCVKTMGAGCLLGSLCLAIPGFWTGQWQLIGLSASAATGVVLIVLTKGVKFIYESEYYRKRRDLLGELHQFKKTYTPCLSGHLFGFLFPLYQSDGQPYACMYLKPSETQLKPKR